MSDEVVRIGEQDLPLTIKRNKRAKRICLRYNPSDHALSLTLPQRVRVEDGIDFIERKSDWLIHTLSELPMKKHIKPGVVIPVLGERTRVRYVPEMRASMALVRDELRVNCDRDVLPRRLEESLKKIVRNEISDLAHYMAKRIGRKINRISVRDTRSRWGSCSSTGNLSFSWRLVFAPRDVLEYVVAHEVAHLRHMNHSWRFWDTVEQICPDYEDAKEWLRQNGKELYRYSV